MVRRATTLGLAVAACAWTVESSPQVDIGAADGPGHDLDLVRGAVRLSDGRIVVLNGGTSELRFYDSTGKYLSASGGRGNGPGESTDLALVQMMLDQRTTLEDAELTILKFRLRDEHCRWRAAK